MWFQCGLFHQQFRLTNCNTNAVGFVITQTACSDKLLLKNESEKCFFDVKKTTRFIDVYFQYLTSGLQTVPLNCPGPSCVASFLSKS